MANFDTTPSYAGIKYVCDDVAAECKKEWQDTITSEIAIIKKKVESEEAARIKKEKEEAAARFKKQQEEEAARLRKQQEEEQKALIEKKGKRLIKANKILKKIFIVFSILFALLMLLAIIGSKDLNITTMIFAWAIVFVVIVLLPYHIIKWIMKKIIMHS